jgi:Fe-S oxidoreductase
MGINLTEIITEARGLVPRDRSPGQIQKTADQHRRTSNNMALSPEDWVETAEWMAEEARAELGSLELPLERAGAEYFATVNSKLPMYYPVDLQDIFKIFHVAGVSWTVSKRWWEGTNYAMFTGDEPCWEETLRSQVAEVERLGCRTLAYTECGHGYYATLTGYARFGIRPAFNVVHVVQLYARWIREGRFRLDPGRNPGRITIHDPCNAVRKAVLAGIPSIEDDARFVLRSVCQDFVEPSPSRGANYCCSGGGGALLNGFRAARNYYGKAKVDQIDGAGAAFVCTPCVNCYDGLGNLAQDFGRPWRPVHLWKLLARAIVV